MARCQVTRIPGTEKSEMNRTVGNKSTDVSVKTALPKVIGETIICVQRDNLIKLGQFCRFNFCISTIGLACIIGKV